MKMISRSNSSANDDDSDKPLLKKLCVHLCMPQNCLNTFWHVIPTSSYTFFSCGKNANITLAGNEEVGREKRGRGRREIYHCLLSTSLITPNYV